MPTVGLTMRKSPCKGSAPEGKVKILLTPRETPAYGQDFLLAEGMESIGLTRLIGTMNGYEVPPTAGKPKLVVSHNPDDPKDSSFVSSLATDVPVVVHVHLQWGYIEVARKRCARTSIRRATFGVVPTDFMRVRYQAEFPNVPWRVIKYGLNAHRFSPSTEHERDKFRSHHGFESKDVVAIHVGALRNSKGLQVLTKLVAGLDATNSRTQLVLQFLANSNDVAIQQYRYNAEALANRFPKRVRLVADRDPLVTDRAVRYCDLLIMPSLKEVCPLVVLEAFLSGVPVVTFNATPFYDELQHTVIARPFCTVLQLPERFNQRDLPESQLLLSHAESSSLASGLLALCANWNRPGPEDRAALASQAKGSCFTLPRMLAEFQSIYDSCSASSASM